MKATLIAVAVGDTYISQTYELFDSAILRFLPGIQAQRLRLPGLAGPWPTATITRPRVMIEHWEKIKGDYVFCIDADMRIDGEVGEEILGEIVATQHPGYVGHHPSTLPYDRNELSRAFIPMGATGEYYCGGFYGGERESVRDLLEEMAWICEGPTPRWHDESALNRCLQASPPTVILDPGYCDPESDEGYRAWWPEQWERKITALDKTPDQRGDR